VERNKTNEVIPIIPIDIFRLLKDESALVFSNFTKREHGHIWLISIIIFMKVVASGKLTSNINVLNDVKHVIFVDFPLSLSIQNVIYGTFQPFVVRGLGAGKLPANNNIKQN
jgi:hypothetical protein